MKDVAVYAGYTEMLKGAGYRLAHSISASRASKIVCGRRYVTINPWVANHSSVQERSPFRKWPFPPAATKSTCRDGLRWSKRISNPWSPVRRLTGGFYARGTKGSNPFPLRRRVTKTSDHRATQSRDR